MLRQRIDSHVFQATTVVEIIESVFVGYAEGHDVGAAPPSWRWDLKGSAVYRKRSLCTQYEEIALASIRVFSDDGQLDVAELDSLMDLALRDRVVDEDERRVLANVLAQAEQGEVSAEVATRIAEVRRRHRIPG